MACMGFISVSRRVATIHFFEIALVNDRISVGRVKQNRTIKVLPATRENLPLGGSDDGNTSGTFTACRSVPRFGTLEKECT